MYIVIYYNTFYMYLPFLFLKVEESIWSLPVTMDNGKVRLTQSGLTVVLETDFGLRVQYNWGQYLVVSLPRHFMGRMCGLCGNFNANDKDDLISPAGTLVGSVADLGKSWRVPGVDAGTHCQDGCSARCMMCQTARRPVDMEGAFFCDILTKTFTGPLRECAAVIPPKVYQENCLSDVCMGKSMKKFLCDTLQVYTDACQQAGFKVLNWRAIADCRKYHNP